MRYKLSHPDVTESDIEAVARVLRSGNLVQGAEVKAFEAALAEFLVQPNVAAVSSGTAALHLALLAAGIGPGDAVLVPNFSFAATGNAISMTGAEPVFIDVDPRTYCINLEMADGVCSSWTRPEALRALVVVHEFGCPVDVSAALALAERHSLVLVEDAACAIGATDPDQVMVGTRADYGCFSFHPRKTLTTGEGGLVTARHGDDIRRVRQLRDHGIDREQGGFSFATHGLNYRLTDFQAALGRSALERLPAALAKRRQLSGVYHEALANVSGISLPAAIDGHSWQTFMVRLDARVDRERMSRALAIDGIQSGPGAQAMLSLPSYAALAPQYDHEGWRSTDLYHHGLALPFCHSYQPDELRWVANRVRHAATQQSSDGH